MTTALIITKLVGIYFIVSGLFLAFRSKTLILVLKDLIEHKATAFLAGVVLVFGGGLLVLLEIPGTDNVSVFAKIMAWMILIKGVVYILMPELLNTFIKKIPSSVIVAMGVILTILGIFLVFGL